MTNMQRAVAVAAAAIVCTGTSPVVGQSQPYGVNSVTYPAGVEVPNLRTSRRDMLLRAHSADKINQALAGIFPEAWRIGDDGVNVGATMHGAGQRNCFITQEMPKKPKSLMFCHKFNDESCGVPQVDDDNDNFFRQLTNLGLSCRLRGDIRQDPLAKIYCINCDPNQPYYIRPTMAINNSTDTSNINNIENMAIADYADGSTPVNGQFNQLLISKDWAFVAMKTEPLLYGPDDHFADCGLLVSTPCQGDSGTLDGRDRYTCGDDLYIPPEAFKVLDITTGEINFVQSFEKMLNQPDLATPEMSHAFYYRMVDDRYCTDAEAAASTSPECLRTAEQLTNVGITGLTTTFGAVTTFQDLVCNIDCAAQTCTDEILGTLSANTSVQSIMCCCFPWANEMAFNSASAASPSVLLMALLVCLTCLLSVC
eukprot:m.59383 g.59383  ORF g.59383 m.59383 type:complete len:424 (-) comp7887_c0_seq1:200-1471(-)